MELEYADDVLSITTLSCMSQPCEALAVQPMAATAVHMLDVAERLFAQRGIDVVSIREIVRESGQSNLSAAHYHFGSREALVAALLTRRLRTINAIRHKRLDALEAAGLNGDVHAIVKATLIALAEVVKTTDWGPNYVRVVAQVILNSQSQVIALVDPDTVSALVRGNKMLRQVLMHLTPQVFKDRIWIVNNESTYSLARWVYAHGPVRAANRRRFDALLLNTVDFLAAGLLSPQGAKGHKAGSSQGPQHAS